MQLDERSAGFAFSKERPARHAMSQAGESAADFVNHADEAEIARVLKEYGRSPCPPRRLGNRPRGR